MGNLLPIKSFHFEIRPTNKLAIDAKIWILYRFELWYVVHRDTEASCYVFADVLICCFASVARWISNWSSPDFFVGVNFKFV